MDSQATIHRWVSHKLDKKVESTLRVMAIARDAVQVAVMPDVHLSGEVCNGVVFATEELIYPQCVGGDIGCGYLSVELDVPDGGMLESDSVLAGFWANVRKAVPVNKHCDRSAHESSIELTSECLRKSSMREGRVQLGTLGRGNHFVELQCEDHGVYSLLIHSGSRAMGQKIFAHHLANAAVDARSGLMFLDSTTDAGLAYLRDQEWARQYARANRMAMLRAIESSVLSGLGIQICTNSTIHLDHNHVQREVHCGHELWIHRKGAQVLAAGDVSVIPGSMGSATYVVEGKQNSDSFHSCSHGAGRSMSRKEAASRLSVKKLRREINGVWCGHSRIEKLVDEAPSAYKNIRNVMKAQKELVRIVGVRQPILNFKGR